MVHRVHSHTVALLKFVCRPSPEHWALWAARTGGVDFELPELDAASCPVDAYVGALLSRQCPELVCHLYQMLGSGV